ncbi:hypothetical protein K523DRAFT_311241 [Schizophyllum commune Tattone D]|nr:hypothetical protein K523DRAFT_311241 [Schizophyllum commune Tattone D]
MKRHIKDCEVVDSMAKDKLEAEVAAKQQKEAHDESETGTRTDAGSKHTTQTFFKISEAKPFSPQRQAEFEHDLLKLFVIMNVAWHAANDPYVRHFFKTWVPGARIPDRKTLSTRVLDEEVKTITDDVKVEVQQQYATGTVDGWSTKKDAIQCTGFNVNGKEYPGQLHITTPERKTSANLFEHVINDIQWMLTLGIILVAFCCDSGGDSRGLRPLLLGVMPWILTIPCWGHQVSTISMKRVYLIDE